MSADSKEKKLPFIQGVRLGALFNSQTGQSDPPREALIFISKKLKEPRTWQRWTVVRTGPDLYRALYVPYPLALKVLAGQAPEPDVPLVEWRHALSTPNCRALLLQASTETRERVVQESAKSPAVNPDLDKSHFVQRVVSGRQLFIFVIMTANDEKGNEIIDSVFENIPPSGNDFEGTRLAFKMLNSYIKKAELVNASFSFHPKKCKRDIRSLEEAVKLLSDFLSQPERVAEPGQKSADDEESSSDDDAASGNPMAVIRCFLRPCLGHAASQQDPPAMPPPKKRTRETKQDLDRLYHNCLKAKELLDKEPGAKYRDYQKVALEERRNAIGQIKGEFEVVIKKLSVFEKSGITEEEKLINKHKYQDFEAETREFLEMLEYKLPPSTETLNLLLLGKTGHGKSSTGNTILQLPDAFESSGDTLGTTTRCRVRMAEVDGRVFKVVDTPEIFDPSDFLEALEKMCTAITLCTEGFHAVLIVRKYGTKMTPEETQSIDRLKRVFGPDILNNHGIFLVTNGDQFELARQKGEHSYKSFEEWQKKQMENDKNFKRIVGECKGRSTLFDNRTEDTKKKKKQLFELVIIVDEMRKCKEYTVFSNDLFTHARRNFEMLGENMKELIKIADELNQRIDALLEAAEKLTPEEYKHLENKLRLIRGYQLNLQDSLLDAEKSERSDGTLKDVFRLEADVVGRMSQAEAFRRAQDGTHPSHSLTEGTLSSEVFNAGVAEIEAKSRDVNREREEKAFKAGQRTAEESGISCFPGKATVRLQDGRRIKMTSLREGDVVLCGKQDGSLIYTALYMFGHKDEFSPLHCWAMSTKTTTLRVSHDHLVFRRHLGCCTAVAARHVQVGDDISVYSPGAATLQWEPVTHIQSQWETGVMAPFTLEGTVVVDDVLASCYVAVTSHALCHALLWPVRKLAVLALRLSANLHRPGEGGLPPWVRLCLHHLLPWLPRHRPLSAWTSLSWPPAAGDGGKGKEGCDEALLETRKVGGAIEEWDGVR